MTGPIRTYSYTLSAEDALAWETLPREITGWGKLGYFLLIFVGGMSLALLPDTWTEGWRIYALAVAWLALIWLGRTLVLTLGNRRRARRRYPQPVAVRVEEWGDHFAIAEAGRQRFMAYETVSHWVTGKRHLFICGGKDLLIIPASVFEPNEMAALIALLKAHDPEATDTIDEAGRNA